MKEEEIENLIEKYKAGTSTLDEEQFLLEHTKDSESAMGVWFEFAKKQKREVAEGFSDTLWQSFQNRKAKRRRLWIGAMSVAATVLLLIAFLIDAPKPQELSYHQKEALLAQALDLLADAEEAKSEENIIYENELIIIYTSWE